MARASAMDSVFERPSTPYGGHEQSNRICKLARAKVPICLYSLMGHWLVVCVPGSLLRKDKSWI